MNLYAVLIIFFLASFSFLAWKNLAGAIYFIVFALPSYQLRFNCFGLPLTVLEIMILVLFLVWLVKFFQSGNLRSGTRQQELGSRNILFLGSSIFVFLLAATISMFIGPELKAAAGIWKAYFIEPIMFFVVFVSVIQPKDFKTLFKVLAAQVLLLSLLAIHQKFTGSFIGNEFWAAQATRRVTSVFAYPNALALYLGPILIMIFGGLIKEIQDARCNNQTNPDTQTSNNQVFVSCFLFLVSCAALGAVYFTKSKGALLGVLAGLVFYSLFFKSYRRFFVWILGTLGILGILFFAMTGRSVNWRGEATVAGGDSITTRIEMWQETWQLLKTRPIPGAGLAGYQSAAEPYHKKDYIEVYLYPHNWALNFWVELGLLGLMGFLGIIGWFYGVGFKQETRNKKQETNKVQIADHKVQNLKIVLLAGMTTVLVHGLVDVPYFKNDLSVLFWLICGMMVVAVRDLRAVRV